MNGELRSSEKIEADLAVLAEHEREYGHLRLRPTTEGLSEIGLAGHRLADDVGPLLAEVTRLRAKVERVEAVCEQADRRGAATVPDGVTFSGFVPSASAIFPPTIRAALADRPSVVASVGVDPE